ncbi:pseudouridine synthase [Methylocucumis oryzae]|nr:pseudouridine synthase [Methylocucumis oryzae]
MLIALNKPYDVLSQFTPELPEQRTLAECGLPPKVYPIGRLDRDSEGLLLLSNESSLVSRLLEPKAGHPREYWAQVEGIPSAEALERLQSGDLMLREHRCLPCKARIVEHEPELPPRTPPIRFRANIPTSWLSLELTEGKNRQVRRMTAAVGYPTLRLVRVRIGQYYLASLAPGEWRELSALEREQVLRVNAID